MKRVAIVGAGISGLTAAWQMLSEEPELAVTVFEGSGRTGGIVETVRRDGFTIEMGPDSWVTEKSAARELAVELGLGDELISSMDETRRTLLLLDGKLEPLPDNLRMIVPIGREALAGIDDSPLLSPTARLAFHRELAQAMELRRAAPTEDESIASFTERHFGGEVLRKLATPLLSGVFGGDVRRLSVGAVMAPFVAMEREHGSLIAALGEREAERRATGRTAPPIFTTLRSGLETLTDALADALPAGTLRLRARVIRLEKVNDTLERAWRVRSVQQIVENELGPRGGVVDERFDEVVLATSVPASATLLGPLDRVAANLLPREASSAILVAFAWAEARPIALPAGFGFLVPPPAVRHGRRARESRLLAATFVDQKFAGRVPAYGRLVRVFLGTTEAERLLSARVGDDGIAALALRELEGVLGRLPVPTIHEVRRWPLSLPQYAVGHLERAARFERRLQSLPGLHLLGNALHGVGLPDLIRQARSLGREIAAAPGVTEV